MSAAELRQAAETLRERAENANFGPWTAFRAHAKTGPDFIGVTMDLSVDYTADIYSDQRATAQDAEYIATMHPGVGLALADWLDSTAERIESRTRTRRGGKYRHLRDAVTLARLINGGERA